MPVPSSVIENTDVPQIPEWCHALVGVPAGRGTWYPHQGALSAGGIKVSNGVPRAIRIAALTTGAIVVVVGIGFAVLWFVTRPTAQDLAIQKGWETGDRVAAQVMQLADGERIDLATAVGQPWERAVMIRAYTGGDEMNKIVGFPWWSPDDWAGSDEVQRTLAFVAGNTVVAEVEVSPDTFRLDDPVFDEGDVTFIEFAPSDAVFVASRAAGGLVTLTRP